MTAVIAPARSRPRPAARRPALAAARLLRLELRHNAMLWLVPVVLALFWLTTYRKTMALPPLWNLRAVSLQSGAMPDFIAPVAGAAAWMGSREARRHTAELVSDHRPAAVGPPARHLGRHHLLGAGGLPGLPGRRVRGDRAPGQLGRAAVVAGRGRGRGLLAFSALGFAAGALLPSRFTAPLAAIAAFFVVALSTQLIVGSQSYWQVSPIVADPWDIGPDAAWRRSTPTSLTWPSPS